jgi:hypothetical protein
MLAKIYDVPKHRDATGMDAGCANIIDQLFFNNSPTASGRHRVLAD